MIIRYLDPWGHCRQTLAGRQMGGCQNYGPCLGTLNNRCRSIIGTQTGTMILTTAQMGR